MADPSHLNDLILERSRLQEGQLLDSRFNLLLLVDQQTTRESSRHPEHHQQRLERVHLLADQIVVRDFSLLQKAVLAVRQVAGHLPQAATENRRATLISRQVRVGQVDLGRVRVEESSVVKF